MFSYAYISDETETQEGFVETQTETQEEIVETQTETFSLGNVTMSQLEIQKEKTKQIIKTASKKYIYKAGWWIQNISMPIVFVFGFLGNCLSFLVVLQKKYRRLSCSWYMSSLAVSDNISLVMIFYFYFVVLERPRVTWGECLFGTTTLYTCSFIGEFLIIAMTIDRGIAINIPLKASIYCTASKARKVVIFIYALGIALNIPHLFISRADKGICVAYAKDNLPTRIYAWVSVVIYSVVPFTVICGLNCSIIYRLKQQQKQFSKTLKSQQYENDSSFSLQTVSSTVEENSSTVRSQFPRSDPPLPSVIASANQVDVPESHADGQVYH